MKIAISASGDSMDSSFEPRFGRANGFIIYDTETGTSYFVDNTANQNLPQGAGIQTAQMIVQQGAEVLVTGNIGPKATQALAQTNLKIFNCQAETVSQALKAYQTGATQPSGQGDPGAVQGPGQGQGRGGAQGGGRGMGGGARGRGPGQGGRGMGGGARGRGPSKGGRGKGGGGRG